MDNQELSNKVGVQTTTLKKIEEKDHFQKHIHEADLFGVGVRKETTQLGRLIDIPKGVPYMFGIGGGLNVLYDLDKNNIPEWKTISWDGDPPGGFEIGRVYFSDNSSDYAEIGKNHEGSSIWQKIEEEPEKLSWKTGRKEWEFKLYFGPENRHGVELNNDLNEKGWAHSSTINDEDVDIPDGLESIRLEPSILRDGVINHFLVLDPERAEVVYVKPRELDEVKETKLENDGWTFVDSNIARIIFVKTKNYEESTDKE